MADRRLTEAHPPPWKYVARTGDLLDADGKPLARIALKGEEAARLGVLLASSPALHELLRQLTGHLAWSRIASDPELDDILRQAICALKRAFPQLKDA